MPHFPHCVAGLTYSVLGEGTVNTEVTSLPVHGGDFPVDAAVNSQGASIAMAGWAEKSVLSWVTVAASAQHSTAFLTLRGCYSQPRLCCYIWEQEMTPWLGLSMFCSLGPCLTIFLLCDQVFCKSCWPRTFCFLSLCCVFPSTTGIIIIPAIQRCWQTGWGQQK